MNVYVISANYDYDGYTEPQRVFAERAGAEKWVEKDHAIRKSKGYSFSSPYEIFEMGIDGGEERFRRLIEELEEAIHMDDRDSSATIAMRTIKARIALYKALGIETT